MHAGGRASATEGLLLYIGQKCSSVCCKSVLLKMLELKFPHGPYADRKLQTPMHCSEGSCKLKVKRYIPNIITYICLNKKT